MKGAAKFYKQVDTEVTGGTLPWWKTGANIVIDVWQLLSYLLAQAQKKGHNLFITISTGG
jgi:hypothetical protein